jgi:methylase of polypeptide subunit release factors
MRTDPPTPAPRVLPAEIAALRADLSTASYLTSTVEALLGPVATAALRRENPVPALRRLEHRQEPAAVLLRLFTLGDDVPGEQVREALPTLGAEGARRLGLVGPADAEETADPADPADPSDPAEPAAPEEPLRALVDLTPYSASDDAGQIDWWIASDLSELATGRPLGPEHVLGVGGASLTLARITPREKVGRVLDLGCGGGIQALHASRHAEHVVATDLSARALGFAAFNAALNGADLDLRQGSLLDPVDGETFDLIVSNPPFVITPRAAAREETSWTYRDGGRAGDTLLAELLRALPAHLAPGGSAALLGNWEISDPDRWDAHPRAWLGTTTADGVDAWVLEREQEDPAQYAETWVRDGGVTSRDPRWPALIGAWLTDLESREVAAIGFGYLLLRRPEHPTSRPGVLRTQQAPGTGSGTLAVHLAAGLHALDALESVDDDALAASRPLRAEDVVERRHLTPGQWDPMLIELVQGAGLARVVRADQLLAATVGALDGTLTLGQVLGAVCALTDADEDEARARVLPAVRELILDGMVTL